MAQEINAIADGVPEETDPASPSEKTGAGALSPGTRLGAYEIGRRIGVGSMGAVYEGARVADGKPVAIKLLAADLAEEPGARARFLNEAKLAARVPHPYVVAILDSGEASERVYLVMELLAGEDLARRLQRSGPMSVGEAVDALAPVCDALAAAHRGGVTHRDLKPSNIFLTAREGRLYPMLLDFGVATDMAPDNGGTDGDASLPLPWKGGGTPMYLAPELVADRRAAGPLSDEYALGAILYETLTGEPPYSADDLPQLLQTIAAGHPPSARAKRPAISAELDAVVLRAMSADPKERFPSVGDLGRALRPFAASPAEQEQLRRRRPPTSPAIELEMATPSPFVRTLVPEHEAESGPWFFAPDAPDELSDEAMTLWPGSPSAEDDARSAEDDNRRVEADSSRVEDDGAAALDPSPEPGPDDDLEVGPPSPVGRAFPVDWQAVSSFATKHRRIVLGSGIALLGITLLFVVRGGRSDSRPGSAPPAAARAITSLEAEPRPAPAAPAPMPVERTEAPPAAPTAAPVAVEKTEVPPPSPAPAAVEKTEVPPPSPAPAQAAIEKTEVPPPSPAPAQAAVEKTEVPPPSLAPAQAAVEKTEVPPPSPAPAQAAVEKTEVPPPSPAPAIAVKAKVPPTRRAAAPTIAGRADVSQGQPKAAVRREQPVSARAESPLPKVVSPAPAATPHLKESAPVRMHNGVPLLD